MYEKIYIECVQFLQTVRSQFIANVSHELRTPIFVIQGYIETLLNGAYTITMLINTFWKRLINIRFL